MKRDGDEVGGPQMLKTIATGVYRPWKKWAAAALLRAPDSFTGMTRCNRSRPHRSGP